MAKGTVVVKAEEVDKDYDLGKALVHAVRDISFEVVSGEYVILFGPSGCGKSTVLNLVAGLEKPTHGRIIIRGQRIDKFSRSEMAKYRRRKIGLVFQNFNLIRSMNTVQNIAYPLMASGISKRVRERRALNILKRFEMKKIAKQHPTQLSGGEQQRVAICRALSCNPWILIADEPTGNVDSKNSQVIMDIFYRQNRKSKRTVLLVTHNQDYLKYANRVFYMKDGKIEKVQVIKEKVAGRKGEEQYLDLEDLPHIGEKLAERLEKEGFHEVEDIADSTPEKLSKIEGVSEGAALEIIRLSKKEMAKRTEEEKRAKYEEEE